MARSCSGGAGLSSALDFITGNKVWHILCIVYGEPNPLTHMVTASNLYDRHAKLAASYIAADVAVHTGINAGLSEHEYVQLVRVQERAAAQLELLHSLLRDCDCDVSGYDVFSGLEARVKAIIAL